MPGKLDSLLNDTGLALILEVASSSPVSANDPVKILLDKDLTANCHIENRTKLWELILTAMVLMWAD